MDEISEKCISTLNEKIEQVMKNKKELRVLLILTHNELEKYIKNINSDKRDRRKETDLTDRINYLTKLQTKVDT